jgi:hypothetical protein
MNRTLVVVLLIPVFMVTASAVWANPSPDSTVSGNSSGRTYLVPELEGAGYRVSPGPRQFKRRLSFSPAVGQLGNQDLFSVRLAFNPNAWLGYEIDIGHNPTSSLHALLHTFNLIVRYPVPWRLQPYVAAGYGMMTVYPGQAINADPVTKNTITAGGGLELYIRDDVAVRGEVRGATVLGQDPDSGNTVTYGYRIFTIGFSFYRSIGG